MVGAAAAVIAAVAAAVVVIVVIVIAIVIISHGFFVWRLSFYAVPRIDPNDRQLNGKLFFFIALIPTIRSINKKSFYALGFFPRHYMEALVLFDVDLLTY